MTIDNFDRYWQQFCDSPAAEGLDVPEHYNDAYSFGSSPESAVEIAELVLAGIVTATGSLVWRYEHEGSCIPQAGDLNIITDGKQPLFALFRRQMFASCHLTRLMNSSLTRVVRVTIPSKAGVRYTGILFSGKVKLSVWHLQRLFRGSLILCSRNVSDGLQGQ